MKKAHRRESVSAVVFAVVFSFGLIGAAWAETDLHRGGLGALERRAILAQALVQQVEAMEREIDQLRDELAVMRKEVDELRADVARGIEEKEALQKKLGERDKEIARQTEMLAIFRSGSFEYYEVREGDTLERIAANPMVYGDPSRAAFIRQANALPDGGELLPGTILMIPRYPEGVLHDL